MAVLDYQVFELTEYSPVEIEFFAVQVCWSWDVVDDFEVYGPGVRLVARPVGV